jgi:hypothetical protein
MRQVGFKSTIPAFQRVKTVHALDRAATVIGKQYGDIIKLKTNGGICLTRFM